VGHEPDITIADLVADQRAPTPSAAAELAVPDATQMARLIHTHMQTLDTALGRLLDGRRRELRHTLTRLQAHAPSVAAWERRLAGLWHRLAELSQLQMQRLRQRLDGLRAQLDALNPRAVLARGYAIVQKRGDKVVTSVAHVAPGDALDVFVVDGCFPAEVSQQYGF
jgi:exodeoxyribonuclease VII large subunit